MIQAGHDKGKEGVIQASGERKYRGKIQDRVGDRTREQRILCRRGRAGD